MCGYGFLPSLLHPHMHFHKFQCFTEFGFVIHLLNTVLVLCPNINNNKYYWHSLALKTNDLAWVAVLVLLDSHLFTDVVSFMSVSIVVPLHTCVHTCACMDTCTQTLSHRALEVDSAFNCFVSRRFWKICFNNMERWSGFQFLRLLQRRLHCTRARLGVCLFSFFLMDFML